MGTMNHKRSNDLVASNHFPFHTYIEQDSIASLSNQQKQLFDKFCTLRQKYDGVKAHLCDILWGVLPLGQIPGVEGNGPTWLEAIPPLDGDVCESPTQIGHYEIGRVLGEGQFASVCAIKERQKEGRVEQSSTTGKSGDTDMLKGGGFGNLPPPPERAVKMINKAGVTSLTTLRRVDNEIAVLRLLKHEGVLKLHEVGNAGH